uniref:Protein-tyrosine-phosphatase n=1 Tax=viral metagenome TaxID=1070528 RepID=A0A6C0JAC2_9ZZZZ
MNPICIFENYSKILPRLYIGNLLSSTCLPKQITHVVNVTQDVPRPNYILKGNYLQVKIDDSKDENILQYFNITGKFIDAALKEGGVVLVHCYMGVSRSVSVVAAYLLYKRFAKTTSDALSYIEKKRCVANPNSGFIRQLKIYSGETRR